MDALLKRLDKASRDGDINKLMELMDEDPSLLDSFDHDVPEREACDNPLHISASLGHVDFTIEVLQFKPKLAQMPNRDGRLPLHLAAARGHLQVVEKLVDQQDGQNLYLYPESKYGYMPAHIATINGKHTIMKMLIERCKDVLDKTTHRKETLMHLAVIANCIGSVRYLINQDVNLNEKDVDGNTCLHLACQKKNHQIITHLLEQDGIEVNSINARGLTPLDVLLVYSCDSATNASLVNMLRRVGGEEAVEQGTPKANFSNSKPSFSIPNKHKGKTQNEAQTLLLVATLVATITFPAISNPPGGFIQLPFEKKDMQYIYNHGANNSLVFKDWTTTDAYPAGRPVLLWQLKAFFLLDSIALFSSISVILFLLCRIPRTKIVMKLLAGILWLASFCTGLAFASAFSLIYIPDLVGEDNAWLGYLDLLSRIEWVFGLLISWCVVYIIAGLWSSYQVITFLWRKGGFKWKGNLPNWIHKVGWPKNRWLKKMTSVTFMVCFLATLSLCAYGTWLGFTANHLITLIGYDLNPIQTNGM
ncbi:hypothetical protein LUZ62_079585 [Rhynchospora pubera]|uniref:PGG domain-containing protein n=1 Tax=Rhynchospora pubera TaxID=906938 RepID=A0AAV8BQ31_9POAL|nr:hypothetical protein LUZ62_079585 [Rhynchospora pubera]